MCRSVSRCLATCRLREHRAQVFESERIGPDVSGKSDYNVVLAFERLGHGGDCLVIFIEQFFKSKVKVSISLVVIILVSYFLYSL